FFFSSRRRHTRSDRDWSSDVCSSDLHEEEKPMQFGLTDHERLRRELQADARVRALLPRIQFSGLVSNGDKTSIFIGAAVEPQERSEERRVGKGGRCGGGGCREKKSG